MSSPVDPSWSTSTSSADSQPRAAKVAVRPRAPLRMPRSTGGDRVCAHNGASLERLLVLDDQALRARVRRSASGEFLFSAEPVDPARLEGPGVDSLREADESGLEEGIARMRFSLGIDQDL